MKSRIEEIEKHEEIDIIITDARKTNPYNYEMDGFKILGEFTEDDIPKIAYAKFLK